VLRVYARCARLTRPGSCPSCRAYRCALVRNGALLGVTLWANIALVRYAARNGENNATNMYCLPGQPGLLPCDDDGEKGLCARRQMSERLPHTSCPQLPGNLPMARVLPDSYL
jgi:hypothetical protein